MSVKALIELFDSPSSGDNDKRSPSGLPPSGPARFISLTKGSLNGKATGMPADVSSHPLLSNLGVDEDLSDNSHTIEPSLDIADVKTTLGMGGNCESVSFSEIPNCLPSSQSFTRTTTPLHADLSHPHHIPGHHFPPHVPVPATTLFSRSAAPLRLPKLDNYLASLPAPDLQIPESTTPDAAMFPPMDRLAASGFTLDDLEANSREPPFWRNSNTLLGSAVNIVLGFTGSSALATFYSLQGLFNTVQLFALVLSTIVPVRRLDLGDTWRKVFLGTIPNILALNLASTVLQSLVFLLVFMAIATWLLYYFYRLTPMSDRYGCIEGLQRSVPKGQHWGIVVITFLLTVIYLPLSTMAVHVLVWSEDLWVVPNPYVNATLFPPAVPPLGPPSEFRDPLDFCWTTTMKKNEINYAPAVIIISALVFISLTIWFPLALRQVIKRSVPRVDPFTELGRPRSRSDKDNEYQRLLARDRNPFGFLYGGFRRGWATYESTYLFAKLSTLFIVAVIDSNNCFFRSFSRTWLPIVRQLLLLVSTIGFFLAQCFLGPFLDPVNNASEWVSRLNYVTTSAVALGAALNIPGKDILDTYVLYVIYAVTYGFSTYFTLINMAAVQRLLKRLTRRIDFSIDIFSPWLDLSPSSPHIKRRIWQESITTLLLTNSDCRIPHDQDMTFAQSRDLEFPPYLLDFGGSPGERHVENLKILREVGSVAYHKGVVLVSGPDHALYHHLAEEIQEHFVGPDCYWRSPSEPSRPGCKSFFGNAWWIPFPPTLVIRYDDGPYAVLQEIKDMEAYITQNSDPDIQRRREVRLTIRALDGQVVKWPYERVTPIGANSVWYCKRRRYRAKSSVHYVKCTLQIKHRGQLNWKGLEIGSGFYVELLYAKDLQVSGDVIGLNDDFDLTPALAQFLSMNRGLIQRRLGVVDNLLRDYSNHHKDECRRKLAVLTYAFLANVYDQPHDTIDLAKWCMKHEQDIRVRQLIVGNKTALSTAYDRLAIVSRSEAATWWYIFWDDFWRRNNDAIPALKIHASDFNPHYPSSIAYTPLPRASLESFLTQRGLMSKVPRWRDVFHHGLLNKIYMRLNEAVFHGSSRAVMFHIGEDKSELDMENIDFGHSSTMGTGGGTDHDDANLRPRPTYRWEGLLSDPVRKRRRQRDRIFAKLGAWLGLTPLWRSGLPSKGVSLDVRLDNGYYVPLEDVPPDLDLP